MKHSKKNKKDISEYILPIVGPMIGVILVSLICMPLMPEMTFVEYIILLGKTYLGVVGFAVVVFIFTAVVMLLARIPFVGRILFSDAAKRIKEI